MMTEIMASARGVVNDFVVPSLIYRSSLVTQVCRRHSAETITGSRLAGAAHYSDRTHAPVFTGYRNAPAAIFVPAGLASAAQKLRDCGDTGDAAEGSIKGEAQ